MNHKMHISFPNKIFLACAMSKHLCIADICLLIVYMEHPEIVGFNPPRQEGNLNDFLYILKNSKREHSHSDLLAR